LNYSFEIESEKSIRNEESTIVEKDQNREVLEIFENILSAQNSVEAIKEIEINSDVKASSDIKSNKKAKARLEQQNLKNSKIPSLDEFIEYAKSLEGYEPELELSISENMKVG
jgi:hypothetical protein